MQGEVVVVVVGGRLLTQVCEVLGADGLIYQDVDDLIEVGRELNTEIHAYDASCFDGKYCTGEREGRGTRGKGHRTRKPLSPQGALHACGCVGEGTAVARRRWGSAGRGCSAGRRRKLLV